jgi:hypothetical protein
MEPQSGQLLQALYPATGPSGPVQRTLEYSDWRPVDGLKLAFKRVVRENGKVVATDEIKSLQLNPPVDPEMFGKPATPAAAPQK